MASLQGLVTGKQAVFLLEFRGNAVKDLPFFRFQAFGDQLTKRVRGIIRGQMVFGDQGVLFFDPPLLLGDQVELMALLVIGGLQGKFVFGIQGIRKIRTVPRLDEIIPAIDITEIELGDGEVSPEAPDLGFF